MKSVTYYRWDDMPKERVSPTLERRLITGERMMLAHVYLAKGCIVPRHSHDNEQITYILEGALKFEIEGKEIVVAKGEVLRIPSNVPHSARSVNGPARALDIFHPIREDWASTSAVALPANRPEPSGEDRTSAPKPS